ncbi:MAG: peptidylprolyl isomerase [Castellaniella sp.]|uniref:SurA N-terminal domain-containing protein n=1 Tax=Castellaniella sp. TaxID=1955812 RepID=UPI001208FCF2|nr:SurA N-terminal domain-containing protein [Castellaniella sp.]TAN26710.1 MAG: peptidylprolyl isomerase [Castellaniella sp.]
MFEFIRTHNRLMQLLLLIFVVPSFVFLGVSGYSFVTSDPDVVQVGRLSVTKEEFTQAQRNQLQQMQESSQGRFDPALLDNPQARQALLGQLVDRKVQMAVAAREHFSVSDSTLRRAISSMPQLQVEGQFSPDRYHQVLAQSGLSPRDFEAGQRAELALTTVLGPVGSSVSLPTPVLDYLKRALTEERTIALRVFQASDYRSDVKITPDDVKTWYDGHQKELRLPDEVAADYLVLDEAAAMASVPAITESQLKGYYEQNKSRYVVPARVNLSHILIKVPSGATDEIVKAALAKAQDIDRRAKAEPSRFADLASKESQDAGTAREGGKLGWIQRGTLPLAMEQVVFGLKQGEISDPVKGPDGYHIFFVNEAQPEKGETFAEARPRVEDEVHRQLAADRFADMATKLTSLVYDNASSLDPAAKQLGLQVRHASGIARDRLLAADEAGPQSASASKDAAVLGDARVRQALFSAQVLNDKQNSGVIEISPDTMVVVRVDKLTPSHVPALAQVDAHIRTELLNERSLAAAVAAGKKSLASLQNEASAEGFQPAVTVSRMDPKGLGKPILDAAFSVSGFKLPMYDGVALPTAYSIVRVDHIQPGTTDKPALNGLGAQLAQVWGAAEEQALLADLRSQLKVRITDEGHKLIEGSTGS